MPEPSKAVKITRNMSGKANVKKADAGLRQNALLVYRTCRAVRATDVHRALAALSRPARPRRPGLTGPSAGAGPPRRARRAAGELEVDVLERGPDDAQVVELDAMLHSPARQAVEGGREVLGDELDAPVGGRAVGDVVGQGRPGGEPEADPGLAWSRPPMLEGGPRATIRPAAMTATRSARNWASSM